MNRKLMVGDRVEFRPTEAAEDLCQYPPYRELRGCRANSQTWCESGADHVMTVVTRRMTLGRPLLEVSLSWASQNIFVWASLMRLDSRARRNRFAAKIEAMKEQRRRDRRRRAK